MLHGENKRRPSLAAGCSLFHFNCPSLDSVRISEADCIAPRDLTSKRSNHYCCPAGSRYLLRWVSTAFRVFFIPFFFLVNWGKKETNGLPFPAAVLSTAKSFPGRKTGAARGPTGAHTDHSLCVCLRLREGNKRERERDAGDVIWEPSVGHCARFPSR